MDLYIGTYIFNQEHTVYKCHIGQNAKTLHVSPALSAGPNPSFIKFNKDKSYLYAVNELFESDIAFGALNCFKRDKDGIYRYLRGFSTNGYYPCHIALSDNEKYLFITNYGSGLLCVYTLMPDGALDRMVQQMAFKGSSVDPTRQEASHLHASICTPDNKHLYVTDLGCDFVYHFAITEDSENPLLLVNKIATPIGTGPRHLGISADSRILYICGELADCVLVYEREASTGHLKFLQNISAYPKPNNGVPHRLAAEISCFKGHVYLSNRYTGEKEDSISVFKVNEEGTLDLVNNVSCGGKTPRNFHIYEQNPYGSDGMLVVVNADTNNVVVFRIDDGTLIQVDKATGVQSPVCIT